MVVPHWRGSGYILGAIGFAYACRSPPRTKPRCAGLVPKGSLSLTHFALIWLRCSRIRFIQNVTDNLESGHDII